MIIDFRVRPPLAGYAETHMYRDHTRTSRIARDQGLDPPRTLKDPDWRVFLEEFDAAGVNLGIVPGRQAALPQGGVSNADIAHIVDESEGRLIGFAGVDQSAEDAPQIVGRAIEDLGLVGLALDPGFAAEPTMVDDPNLDPIYDICESLSVPVMITMSGNAAPDIGYSDPVTLDRLAAVRPGMTIVVAHGGWPWVMPMMGVAIRRPNVWISPDQYLIGLPGSQHYVEAANTFLSERLLFGSSYPFMPMDGALSHYRAQPFREDVLPKVLGGNAERLLGEGVQPRPRDGTP